jgi:hypothetical protein
MITILPMADEKRKAEILSSYPMVAAKQDVLVMAEAEEELGYVVLAVDHTNLKLLDMTVSGRQPFAGRCLLRRALWCRADFSLSAPACPLFNR